MMSLVRAQQGEPRKKHLRKQVLFSIQSEGLACNLTAGEYVIAEGVWHHASACILLRIDYIQHFVLIPYRRQAADFIHGFAVIFGCNTKDNRNKEHRTSSVQKTCEVTINV